MLATLSPSVKQFARFYLQKASTEFWKAVCGAQYHSVLLVKDLKWLVMNLSSPEGPKTNSRTNGQSLAFCPRINSFWKNQGPLPFLKAYFYVNKAAQSIHCEALWGVRDSEWGRAASLKAFDCESVRGDSGVFFGAHRGPSEGSSLSCRGFSDVAPAIWGSDPAATFGGVGGGGTSWHFNLDRVHSNWMQTKYRRCDIKWLFWSLLKVQFPLRRKKSGWGQVKACLPVTKRQGKDLIMVRICQWKQSMTM